MVEGKVPCSKTQHNVPGHDSNPRVERNHHAAIAPSHFPLWFIIYYLFGVFFGVLLSKLLVSVFF